MDCKACLTSSVWLQFLPKRMFSTCELCREYGIKKNKNYGSSRKVDLPSIFIVGSVDLFSL